MPISQDFVVKVRGKEKIRSALEKRLSDLEFRELIDFNGEPLEKNGKFGIICFPIPLENCPLSPFSEQDWYKDIGIKTLNGHSFDFRSSPDHLRVLRIMRDGSCRAFIDFYENGMIITEHLLSHSDNPVVEESIIAPLLDNFLETVVQVYNKALFDGGLQLTVYLFNIQGWNWLILNDNHLRENQQPSDEYHLEQELDTTVSAINSNIQSTREVIFNKMKRGFNIY